MISFDKFIQEGGYKFSEIFNKIIINETGVYDKKHIVQIKVETSTESDYKNNIKIISVSNKRVNLGMDRLLYGDIEENEPIYSIEIKYKDYYDIINVEGDEEYVSNIIKNYGNVITHLNKLFEEKNVLYTPMKQGIKV